MIYLISFTIPNDSYAYLLDVEDRESAIDCIKERSTMDRVDIERALQTLEDRVQITQKRFSNRIMSNIMVTVLPLPNYVIRYRSPYQSTDSPVRSIRIEAVNRESAIKTFRKSHPNDAILD